MNALSYVVAACLEGERNVRNTCFKRIVLFLNQNSSTVVIKAVLPCESCPLGDIEETTHRIVNQVLTTNTENPGTGFLCVLGWWGGREIPPL